MLTSTTAALLKVLSEDGGFTTGRVSELAQNISYGGNNRQRSGAIRAWLMELKQQGLVVFLDDQKPICWKRTQAGSRALDEYALKHLRTTSMAVTSDQNS
jgi:hypothetical protein